METLILESDIIVFCITASSFPEGVMKAHQSLHALVPYDERRNYFGISFADQQGSLTYKAAAEELEPGDLSKHQLEVLMIPKGKYAYVDVQHFMQNIPAIGEAFNLLMALPNIDPARIGIEWYLQGEVCRCMMKLR